MYNEKLTKLADYAPAVVRVGVSLVFLWFGFSQLGNPEVWIGLLPDWTASLRLSNINLIQLNGSLEILFGSLLLLGLYVRPIAFLLALHMFHITAVVGYGGVGVRDFGLALATTSVFLYGADKFTLAKFLVRQDSAAVH